MNKVVSKRSTAYATLIGAAMALAGTETIAQGSEQATPGTGEQSIVRPMTHGIDLEMVQDAWQGNQVKKRTGQSRPGAKLYRYCESCVYRVASRARSTTTLRIDESEIVTSIINGNPDALEATKLRLLHNVVEIRARLIGVDTSIKLNTKKGRTYIFWVKTEDESAPTTPDLLVDVVLEDRRTPGARTRPGTGTGTGTGTGSQRNRERTNGAWETMTDEGRALEARDRARIAAIDSPLLDRRVLEQEYGNLGIDEFDPSRMVFDLTVYASSGAAAQALAPMRVFRDDHWTWLDYSNKSSSALLPAASLMTEDTETPVDWAVLGEDGRFLVVKAIGDIVLRSGQHVLCIKLARPEQHLIEITDDDASRKGVTHMYRVHTGGTAPIAAHRNRPSDAAGAVRSSAQPQWAESPRAVLHVYAEDDKREQAREIASEHLGADAGDEPPYGGIAPERAHAACRALAGAGIQCAVERE